jgi:hypothetical protein
MLSSSFRQCSCVLVAIVLSLTACSDGLQSRLFGAFPNTEPSAQARPSQWRPPGTSSGDLLYITSSNGGNVYIFTYPSLQPQGMLSALNRYAAGACVDKAGNVFITTANASQVGTIFEYAHGGSSPINVLSDPGYPWGCSFDPKTGDLTVTNILDRSNPNGPYFGDLAIYKGAKGTPKMYSSAGIAQLFFCGYDTHENLYVDGLTVSSGNAALFELRKGSTSLEQITLSGVIHEGGAVQWPGI